LIAIYTSLLSIETVQKSITSNDIDIELLADVRKL
jgi:hypothetical protein